MKKNVLIIAILLIAGLQIASVALHSNGIAGYTNSPGETTCTDCHTTYPLNSGNGKVSIKIVGCVAGEYVPGTTYTVNVTVVKSGLKLFGLDLEVLDSMGADAGTLNIINSSTTILLSATINSNNRTNGAHYGGVAATDSCVFVFKWKAPGTNIGKVMLYAAGNASNGDGYAAGDYIYTTSNMVLPSASAGENKLHTNEADFFVFASPTENLMVLSYYVDGTHLPIYADLLTLNGQIAMHLFNSVNEAGHQQKRVMLNSLLLKGLYLVRLNIGNNVYYKKVLLQ